MDFVLWLVLVVLICVMYNRVARLLIEIRDLLRWMVEVKEQERGIAPASAAELREGRVDPPTALPPE